VQRAGKSELGEQQAKSLRLANEGVVRKNNVTPSLNSIETDLRLMLQEDQIRAKELFSQGAEENPRSVMSHLPPPNVSDYQIFNQPRKLDQQFRKPSAPPTGGDLSPIRQSIDFRRSNHKTPTKRDPNISEEESPGFSVKRQNNKWILLGGSKAKTEEGAGPMVIREDPPSGFKTQSKARQLGGAYLSGATSTNNDDQAKRDDTKTPSEIV
jgi:hypothetical protein